MAGKSHDLTARVILQGQVDNTFTQIGAQLQNLGTQLLRMNRWAINFGKESLDAFVDFDDAMRDAHNAMYSVYSDNMSAMEADYQKMRQSAMDYAATSKFTTLEVATAYSQAAHAGKDFAESEALVGAAIQLAYAGNMDLSDAMDSLIVITNAAGLSMEDAYTVVDQLTYGGNLAATTVDEITEAMVRFGPGLRFFNGDMAGAVAMFGTLANNGMKGSEAGTALRTAMLRLIAPTQKGADAMTSANLALELGYETIDEYEEAMEDAGQVSEETAAILEEMGFSVYDENGNMKDALTIWSEFVGLLDEVRKERGNEAADSILSSVFSARQIYTARGFVNDIGDTIDDYNNIIENAGGFGEQAAAEMEGGFGGLIRRGEATLNALQTRVGGVLAEDLTEPMTVFQDLLTKIYEMDEGKIGAVAGFFETLIGGAGALVVAGTGIKLIGTAIGAIAGGGTLLAATGMFAVGIAIDRLIKAADEDKLGNMSLNFETFAGTFENLAGAFDGKYVDIKEYNKQMDALIANYETVSQKFTQGLWDMFLNGSDWSEEEWAASQKEMLNDVETLISTGPEAAAQALNVANTVVGEHATGDKTGLWASIQSYIDAGYENVLSDVRAKGAAVRKAVLEAWEDGALDENEVANIQKTLDDYNRTLSDIASAGAKGALALELHNGQTISADTLTEIYKTATERRDVENAAIDSEWGTTIGLAMEGGAAYTSSEVQELLKEYDADITANNVAFGQQMFSIFKTAMLTNFGHTDFGEFLENDWKDAHSFIWEFANAVGPDTLKAMAELDEESRLLYNAYTDVYRNYYNPEGAAGAGFIPDKIGTPWYLRLPEYEEWFKEKKIINTDIDTSVVDSKLKTLEEKEIHIPVFLDLPSDGSPSLANPKGTNRKDGYAEGGRADVASIFGEAGPEWAIPEEHTSRTAELLRMAAEASGFTWSELLSARGGLNAGSGRNVTVVYSPTINANDVNGVREELIADKGRLDKWLREREMKEELVSYA